MDSLSRKFKESDIIFHHQFIFFNLTVSSALTPLLSSI